MSGKKARQRRRERALAFLPNPADGTTPAKRLALELRNRASTTGVCVCGAEAHVIPDPRLAGVFHVTFAHEPDCIVSLHTMAPGESISTPSTLASVYDAALDLDLGSRMGLRRPGCRVRLPVLQGRGPRGSRLGAPDRERPARALQRLRRPPRARHPLVARCRLSRHRAHAGCRMNRSPVQAPEAEYRYTDEDGVHLFSVLRWPGKTGLAAPREWEDRPRRDGRRAPRAVSPPGRDRSGRRRRHHPRHRRRERRRRG